MLDTADDGPFTFINVFEIPEDEIDTFVAQWEERSRFMRSAQGHIVSELHRAVDPQMRFKVVNVSRWESQALFEAARRAPDYQAELTQNRAAGTWTPYGGPYRVAATSSP